MMERHLEHRGSGGALSSSIRVAHINGMLHPRTRAWADAYGAQLVCHDENDGHGYYELLRGWWTEPNLGDLLLVEQDKVPADGAVEDMLACEHDWCVCPFALNDGSGMMSGWALGCVKFSRRLRERLPDAMRLAGIPGEHDPEPPEVWWVMDMRLGCVLARNGVLPHGHAEGRHLHECDLTDLESAGGLPESGRSPFEPVTYLQGANV